VVVPGVEETMATSWRVMAFNSDDLPVLRRPKIPMWSRSDLGVLVIFPFVVVNPAA
jgi:hypothetical protein